MSLREKHDARYREIRDLLFKKEDPNANAMRRDPVIASWIHEFAFSNMTLHDCLANIISSLWQNKNGLFEKLLEAMDNQQPVYVTEKPKSHQPPRTRQQVLDLRGTPMGCCNRHADNMACDCLEEAVP